MREAFFILLVIFVLLGLTAIRYRKQIAGMIGLARALKDAKEAASHGRQGGAEQPGVKLVNCATCDIWVPQDKAVTRQGTYYCVNCR